MKFLSVVLLILLTTCSATTSNEHQKNLNFGNIEIEELFYEYPIFKKGFDNYVPLELIKLKDDDVSVVVFFGTWCHDSKRELPKALKIFNVIGINDENIELIAVDLNKKEPLGRAAKLNLMYTPTLIFFRESKEIGRIIEKPDISLEKDIELIISSI